MGASWAWSRELRLRLLYSEAAECNSGLPLPDSLVQHSAEWASASNAVSPSTVAMIAEAVKFRFEMEW
jgi:hypothetical protein